MRTPPDHRIPTHISVVNHSTKVSDAQVAIWAEAWNVQVREHAAPLWDGMPCGVHFYGHAKHIPITDAAILGVVDDDGNSQTAGYHTVAGDLVYGLVDVSQSRNPSVTGSHEALEMYANAHLDRWVKGPDHDYVVELSDPVQELSYDIEVSLMGQQHTVRVADFVLPRWFGLEPTDRNDLRVDYLGGDLDPFQIARGGYQIAREAGGGRIVYLSQGVFGAKVSRHSRTQRILSRCGPSAT